MKGFLCFPSSPLTLEPTTEALLHGSLHPPYRQDKVDRLYFLPNIGTLVHCREAEFADAIVFEFQEFCNPVILLKIGWLFTSHFFCLTCGIAGCQSMLQNLLPPEYRKDDLKLNSPNWPKFVKSGPKLPIVDQNGLA